MRCPHCAGEIPQASRFCGICGRSLTTPPRPRRTTTSPPPPLAPEDFGSLFEMPPTRKGRAARLFIVLALDAILAIAGIAMIVAYVRARAAATESAPHGEADAGVTAEVKVLPPTPVLPIGDGVTSPATPTANSGERAARSAPARAGREAGKAAPGRGRSPAVPSDPAAPPTPPAPAVRDPVGPLPETAESAAESDGAESGGVRGGSPETIDSGGVRGGSPETIDDESMSRLAARIELVVSSHQGQIQRCYAQAAKVTTPEDPLEGKIDVRFSLMPDGSASNVRAVRNTSGSPQLASCLVGLVQSWAFPDGVSAPIDFLWPFQFSAPRNK